MAAVERSTERTPLIRNRAASSAAAAAAEAEETAASGSAFFSGIGALLSTGPKEAQLTRLNSS